MERPSDAPQECPACGAAYDSVSRHADGLMVALRATKRYGRVCFQPVTVAGTDGTDARIDFYHHTHEQCGSED